MKLSLTAITSRQSRKPVARSLQRLSDFENSFSDLKLEDKEHDCLLLTLVEEHTSHLQPIPGDDGIFQIEVGYGKDIPTSIQPDEHLDRQLCRAILDASERASKSYPDLLSSEQDLITLWIAEWRDRLS